MKEAGLTNVHTSIRRRQNTVKQYIATRPLLDLCKGATQREGARVTLRWWDQSGIDWEKSKAKEFIPWQALNGRHKITEMCRRGADKKRRRLEEAEVYSLNDEIGRASFSEYRSTR